MLTTPITQRQIDLGAHMFDFAGYNMPRVFTTINEEHMYVRQKVGIFDISHMGVFILKGKQALDFVQKISSNDASLLESGQVQYTCLPNADGGIVDDCLLYKLFDDQCAEGEEAFMLVVNGANVEKDWSWISKANTYECRMISISSESGILAVQGPDALKAMQPLTDTDLSKISSFHFKKMKFADCDNILISNTGYTGSGGFEIYAENDSLAKIWDALFAVKDTELKPIGLGARDTLRLEMGYCLYGNDLTDATSPIEAGLNWITKTNKKDDFYSKYIFLHQEKEGIKTKLVGFESDEKRVPRKDYVIKNMDKKEIGKVTSGAMSPSLEKPIGMGYILEKYAKNGTDIYVDTGRKLIKAKVRKMPFIKI